LRAIEDPALRQRLSRTAYEHIRRFFPDAEPKRFWEGYLAELAGVIERVVEEGQPRRRVEEDARGYHRWLR